MVLTWVTTQGPASITVHGIFFPFSSKMLVIPIFLPINPDIFNYLLIITIIYLICDKSPFSIQNKRDQNKFDPEYYFVFRFSFANELRTFYLILNSEF